MGIQSLYILNKAGGLIYQKDFKAGLNKLSTNDYLVLAGTFHSIHAISSQVSPVPSSSGITVVETAKSAIHCFQTITGVKFLLITDLRQTAPENVLSQVYQLFADYVMKNPFYQLDMPIRCDQFDRHLKNYLMEIA